MDQKEYEMEINKVREVLLSGIGLFEQSYRELKEEKAETKNEKMIETLLQTTLLIAHTERGKRLFVEMLQFSKDIDIEIAYKYWNIYDDIENLVKNRFFNITKG